MSFGTAQCQQTRDLGEFAKKRNVHKTRGQLRLINVLSGSG